jgi:hypothetical protein
MGVTVKKLLEAVSWSGSDVVLSLFEVGSIDSISRPPVLAGEAGAVTVVSFYLEDPDRDLGAAREVYEHDLTFAAVPDGFQTLVRRLLEAAIDGGAEVAWFGFEGSFSFEHLLTRDVASMVYGVADGAGVQLAFDDARRESSEWESQIALYRERFVK